MAYSLTDAKSDLTGILHGTSLNKVQNINYGVFNRAARSFILGIDAQETIRTVQITNPIYNQVYDYAVPDDLKGDRIIDIKPQVNRRPRSNITKTSLQNFDLYKNWNWKNKMTVQFNNMVKTLRLDLPFLPAGLTMNTVDSVDGNGTWEGDAAVSNIKTDNLYKAAGSGSVKCDLDATGIAHLENDDMNAVDGTNYLNVGAGFFLVYLPDGSAFTNINFRWGSSNANYYHRDVTIQFDGSDFQNGWNLLYAEWDGSTQVGTPDVTAMNYNRVTYTYTGAQTAVRLDNIVFRLGSIFDIEYYSKYLFRSAAGVFQEKATDDTDLVNLDTESYNLFLHWVAVIVAQQVFGSESPNDIKFFEDLYTVELKRYRQIYPSQVIPTQQFYYRRTDYKYSRLYGSRR